jgi:hypothetical protein
VRLVVRKAERLQALLGLLQAARSMRLMDAHVTGIMADWDVVSNFASEAMPVLQFEPALPGSVGLHCRTSEVALAR